MLHPHLRLALACWLGFFALPAAMATEPGVPASAAAAAEAPAAEPASVAEARLLLQADAGSVGTEMDGWWVVQQPARNAQWSFTPAGHAAHPAVVRRSIVRGADGRRQVVTRLWCEGPAAACQALDQDFARSSDRLQQYLRSRDTAAVPPTARP